MGRRTAGHAHRPAARHATRRVAGLVAAIVLGAGCGGPAPIVDCVARDGVTPVCGFQNPEDVAALGDDWLVVSQAPRGGDAGHLLGFRPRDGALEVLWPGEAAASRPRAGTPCPGPPDAAAFAPHGIDPTHDDALLLVVNHGGREAVEMFEIGRAGGVPALRWVDCVAMPEATMMNDVAALPDGGFVVTQMTDGTLLGMLRIAAGLPSGRVHRWTPGGSLAPIPGTDAVGPNGIEVSPDGRTVYFAAWAEERVVRVGLDGSDRRSASLGFSPDNLSWTADGRLLVAGQLASPFEAAGCFDVPEGACGLASAVARVEPGTLEVERLWTHDPATVTGGISVALEHGDRIWLGSFGGDRLAWIAARP